MFVHVPKCAGTSIRAAIRQAVYGEKKIKQFELNPWASRDGAAAVGEAVESFRTRLLAYQLASASNVFGSGHFPAPPRVVEAFRSQWRFVTILREPTARWQSEYIFNRYKSDAWGRVELDVEAYLATDHARLTATSFLSYFSDYVAGAQQRFEPLIRQAVDNLRRFHLVGRVEEMPVWQARFDDLFGTRIRIEQKNASPRAHAKTMLASPAIHARIAELCEPDIEIYRRFFEAQT